MDNAEVYLVLVRPSMVPVVGEALAMGFQGQVELKEWTWNMHNEKERKKAEQAQKDYSEQESLLTSNKSLDARRRHASEDLSRGLERSYAEARRKFDKDMSKLAQKEQVGSATDVWGERKKLTDSFNKANDKLHKSYVAEHDKVWTEKAALPDQEQKKRTSEIEELERNRSFEFTFSKRVDFSSTQMLNSMKLGDVFPTGTLTIYQRSSNSGMGLVINLLKVRLLDYALKVDVSDTMTDMMEQWTAEFEALSYVYKNRDATGEETGATQAAVKRGSQGTVRTFAMKRTLKVLRSP